MGKIRDKNAIWVTRYSWQGINWELTVSKRNQAGLMNIQKHHLNLKTGNKDTRMCNISVLFKLES